MKRTRATDASAATVIRLRAVVLGTLAIPLNAFWITQVELNRWSFPTSLVPFYNAIFTLALIALCNAALTRYAPAERLRSAELLVVYLMASIASSLCSHNMMEVLVTTIPHAHYNASPLNEWGTRVLPYLPSWLVVSDPDALTGYYQGESTFWRWRTLRAWAPAIGWWTLFTTALLSVMLALALLLRRQWTEREKLTYPIIQLPLALAGEEASVWRQRSLWVGFGITGAATVYNGIATLVPAVPALPLKRVLEIQPLLPELPWNAIRWTPVTVHPHLIGLGFLMPLDLLFSSWFFYWALRWQRIAKAAFGLRMLPEFPYEKEQTLGAYLAVALIALWMGRRHLRAFAVAAWRGRRDSTDDPVAPRVVLLCIAGGIVGLAYFSQAAGLALGIGLAFFVIYYLLAVAMTRMRAEFGFPIHDAHYPQGPDFAVWMSMGTRRLGPQNLTVLALYHWFNRTYASHPMPHQLEAFKMGERLGARRKTYAQIAGVLLLAVVLSVLTTFVVILHSFYRHGSATGYYTWGGSGGFGRETYWWLDRWLDNPTEPNAMGVAFVGVGFAVASFFHFMRTRYMWWSLHPLGYAVSTSWGAHVWSSFLIAWLAKWGALKFGGIGFYRRAVPFFLGVILGEFLVGSVWNWVAILFGVTTYQFSVG